MATVQIDLEVVANESAAVYTGARRNYYLYWCSCCI